MLKFENWFRHLWLISILGGCERHPAVTRSWAGERGRGFSLASQTAFSFSSICPQAQSGQKVENVFKADSRMGGRMDESNYFNYFFYFKTPKMDLEWQAGTKTGCRA